MVESAIDKHMQCPRTLSRRVPDDYTPPFPMFVGRANPNLTQVTMAYLGVQCRPDARPYALAALRTIVDSFGADDGPLNYDLTQHIDNSGYVNLIAVGYWSDLSVFHRWQDSPAVAGWWESDDRLHDGIGYFREIIAPRAEQFETLYAFTENLPGVGAAMDGISGEIAEHGYWGSMRDRMPLSQTDWLEPTSELQIASGTPADGGRVIIQGYDNIALIRSGQDWRAAEDAERSLYLDEILPTLQAGMDFLRDQGSEHGCLSNRFVQSIDLDGNLQDESYNIGHWRSLEKLERWAESHPTHLRIFTTFFRVATQLDKLRLYHEVSVASAVDQYFEYINCHPATGMMRDAANPAATTTPVGVQA